MNSKLLKLRDEIKLLSLNQTDLKQQRKTVNFKGTRTISTSEATWKVQMNASTLRYLHVAYSIMLGNDYSNIESNPKEEIDMNRINKIIAQYYEETVHISS